MKFTITIHCFHQERDRLLILEFLGKMENFKGVEKIGRLPISGHKNYGVRLGREGVSGGY